jgi:type I restriction enzyme S subunit
LAEFQRGFDITVAEQSEGEYPVISSSGISSYHSEARVKGPGVVIGRKGTLGGVYFIESDFWPHDTTLWVKDFKGNDPKFVYYQLRIIDFLRFNVGNANPTLNRNHIRDIPILLPDVDVQEHVAQELWRYDDLIANNQRRITLLEEAARQLYREWFVRLRFPGAEHTAVVDGLPEGWQRMALASVCSKIGSGFTPRGGESSYVESGTPLIRSQNVYDDRFDDGGLAYLTDDQAEEMEGVSVLPRDILLNITGASVARCCMAPDTYLPARVNQHVMIIRVTNPSVSPHFVLRALNGDLHKRQLLSMAQKGATRQALTKEMVEDFEIVIPSEALMREFGEQMEANHRLLTNLARQNRLLRTARDLLLPRLMSGQLTV